MVLFMLIAMIPLLTGAAGIVLFVVGLVKKKPAMWGSGIALGVVSLIIVVIGTGMAFWFGYRSARSASRRTLTRARQAAAVATAQEDPRAMLQTCTGLAIPGNITVTDARTLTQPPPAGQSVYYMRLHVPAEAGGFWPTHFVEASWSDVEDAMTGKQARSISFWDIADAQGKRCYRRTHRSNPSDPDRMVTHVAYDPNAGVAYVVSAQKWDE